MQVFYDWNDKLIFQCNKGTIGSIYSMMMKIIREEKIEPNYNVTELLYQLEQGPYGVGCALSDFIKTKRDMYQFSKLLKKAIVRYEQEYPELYEDIKLLWNFYHTLIEHAPELSTHISKEKMDFRNDIPVYYELKEKEILYSTKKIVAPLLNRILDIIDHKQSELNENVDRAIDELEYGLYSLIPEQSATGIEFGFYLHNQRDIHEFAEILKKAIILYEHDEPRLPQETKSLFWNAYHKFLEIGKELPE